MLGVVTSDLAQLGAAWPAKGCVVNSSRWLLEAPE